MHASVRVSIHRYVDIQRYIRVDIQRYIHVDIERYILRIDINCYILTWMPLHEKTNRS